MSLRRAVRAYRQLEQVVAARQPRQRHVEGDDLPRGILGQRQLDWERLARAIEQAGYAAVERSEELGLGIS